MKIWNKMDRIKCIWNNIDGLVKKHNGQYAEFYCFEIYLWHENMTWWLTGYN